MPLLSPGTNLKIIAIAAAAIGSALAPAAASAACGQAPTTKAFAEWGDAADYVPTPAGDFESDGWTLLNGARIVEEGNANGAADGRRSLRLPRTGIAVSPEFCVHRADPTVRFMTRANSWLSTYQAVAIYRDELGAVTQTRIVAGADTSIFPGGAWKPSTVGPLAAKIPLAPGGTTSIQIMLRADEGSTQFDSVMVDPDGRG